MKNFTRWFVIFFLAITLAAQGYLINQRHRIEVELKRLDQKLEGARKQLAAMEDGGSVTNREISLTIPASRPGYWVTNEVRRIPAAVRVAMGGDCVVLSNVVDLVPDHQPDCTLIRFVEGGVTNEFHAWMATVEEVK